jgi:hypothetical protein
MTTLAQRPIRLVSETGDRDEGLEALCRELAVEADLLRDLRRALIAQRGALGTDDTTALEEVVNQIGRTLLTIREARRQRNLLAEMVAGAPQATLTQVASGLSPAEAPGFKERCRVLHELAVVVSRELTINQAVIRRAIESGEQYLQQLLTVPAPDGYPGRPADGQSGLLLNQRA